MVDSGSGNGIDETETSPDTLVISPAPTHQQYCEMDALLLGRIGELVSAGPNERNWKGICIALLVILSVLGVIVVFIAVLSPPYQGPLKLGRQFTTEDITGDKFKSRPFNGTWISPNEIVYMDSYSCISIFNANTNATSIILRNSTIRILDVEEFKLSADRNFILLATDVKKVYSNRKTALYYIVDLKSKYHSALPLSLSTKRSNRPTSVQAAVWSPDGHGLAFVHSNDLYYKSDPAAPASRRITFNGAPFVYNGVPDWLYQEEILKSDSSVWMAPGGQYLAYASFDDTAVKKYKYPLYVTESKREEIAVMAYPEVGTTNPRVKVRVVNLKENIEINGGIEIQQPFLFLTNESDAYLNGVSWINDRDLILTWTNRAQNMYVNSICGAPSFDCADSHIEQSVEKGWVQPYTEFLFSSDGSGYLTILPAVNKLGTSYPQIYHVHVRTKVVSPISRGQLVVTKLMAWHAENRVIYFEAVPEGKPTEMHLYNITDSLDNLNVWHCLTCLPPTHHITDTYLQELRKIGETKRLLDIRQQHDLETRKIRNNKYPIRSKACLYVKTHFYPLSPQFYTVECLGPDVPKSIIMSAETHNPTFLFDNQTDLAARWAKMAQPEIKMLKVQLESGYETQVKLVFPPLTRYTITYEFPLILAVSGEPGSQVVTQKWSVDWSTYFVSNNNYIVGMADVRGTSGQSDDFKFEIKNKLGVVDVEDQFYVLNFLRENIEYIDRSMTGVWGVRYGGFVATRMIAQDKVGMFKCGAAISPIASLNNYVSVWMERFMGAANISELDDLSTEKGNFGGKRFRLAYATADTKVHYDHATAIVQSLISRRIQFQEMMYPYADHDFKRPGYDYEGHLVGWLEAYWKECFGVPQYDYEEGINIFTF